MARATGGGGGGVVGGAVGWDFAAVRRMVSTIAVVTLGIAWSLARSILLQTSLPRLDSCSMSLEVTGPVLGKCRLRHFSVM